MPNPCKSITIVDGRFGKFHWEIPDEYVEKMNPLIIGTVNKDVEFSEVMLSSLCLMLIDLLVSETDLQRKERHKASIQREMIHIADMITMMIRSSPKYKRRPLN